MFYIALLSAFDAFALFFTKNVRLCTTCTDLRPVNILLPYIAHHTRHVLITARLFSVFKIQTSVIAKPLPYDIQTFTRQLLSATSCSKDFKRAN